MAEILSPSEIVTRLKQTGDYESLVNYCMRVNQEDKDSLSEEEIRRRLETKPAFLGHHLVGFGFLVREERVSGVSSTAESLFELKDAVWRWENWSEVRDRRV